MGAWVLKPTMFRTITSRLSSCSGKLGDEAVQALGGFVCSQKPDRFFHFPHLPVSCTIIVISASKYSLPSPGIRNYLLYDPSSEF